MTNDEAPGMELTAEQAKLVVGIERAGASLSLVGVLLIIITFALVKRLRTVPNTFILMASMANIGASTASLIGLAGVAQGSQSTLCRAQAFLLEMFMQSDPWWSLAMAINVYLVFFHAANPVSFRRHLWVYCLVCFGVPMVPAIVCLYVQRGGKGPVYGDATLWCWIGDNWNALRIFTYYMPIWVCIFLSAVIYVAVGYHVFHLRNQLRNLSLSNPAKDISSSEHLTSSSPPGVYGTVTTDVQITSDYCEAPMGFHHHHQTPPQTAQGAAPNGSCPWGDDGPFPQLPTTFPSLNHHHFTIDEELGRTSPSTAPSVVVLRGATGSPFDDHQQQHNHRAIYPPPSSSTTVTATASVPKSSLAAQAMQVQEPHHDGNRRCYGRHRRHCRVSLRARARGAWHRVASKFRHMDPIKLAYLRTSFVFAISVLVTWTPSSINRVYTLVHPTQTSYGLNIASAAVLPLQGVWNAVIYFTTSWTLLRDEIHRLRQSPWLHRFVGRFGTAAGASSYDRGRLAGNAVGAGGGGPEGRRRSALPDNIRSGSTTTEDDTDGGRDSESASLDTLNNSVTAGSGGGASSTLHGGSPPRMHPARTRADLDLLYPRGAPRSSTLRVQKGGQLDSC
ncbi:g-protein coupled receptor [Niveomyces insectorum RCEF 264]|uniref:G-protein coupled receptor n=1 Tax=Niveomyces insectorum RCEF 264 TaxID=1081102 RepID=A0A167M4P8_9HYPO|nr:g-protein coupled receptor [Niveomyces insectorum RCEF 264]